MARARAWCDTSMSQGPPGTGSVLEAGGGSPPWETLRGTVPLRSGPLASEAQGLVFGVFHPQFVAVTAALGPVPRYRVATVWVIDNGQQDHLQSKGHTSVQTQVGRGVPPLG